MFYNRRNSTNNSKPMFDLELYDASRRRWRVHLSISAKHVDAEDKIEAERARLQASGYRTRTLFSYGRSRGAERHYLSTDPKPKPPRSPRKSRATRQRGSTTPPDAAP